MKNLRLAIILCLSAICLLFLLRVSPTKARVSLAVTPLSTQVRAAVSDDGSPQKTKSPDRLTAKVSDFDGDGRADLALFVPPYNWFIRYSNSPPQLPCTWTPWVPLISTSTFNLTGTTQIPVPGDYNHDSRTDLAVYEGFPATGTTSSNYTLADSVTTPLVLFPPTVLTHNYGFTTDTPLMGDFNVGGDADFTVVRALPSGALEWYVQDSVPSYPYIINGTKWGIKDDYLVPGDYDGDGITDMTIWRPSTGIWWTLTSSSVFTTILSATWGTNGDIPLLGDFDGDGKDDRAVFRPSTSTFYVMNSNGGLVATVWGTSGDIPVPADYDRDGRTDVAVYRPVTGIWYPFPCAPQTFFGSCPACIPVPSVYVKKT